MSEELLAILEQIERERGIKREVLVAALESAILSAARKVIDLKPDEQLRVELDLKTGKIMAFKNEEEINSVEFGRIAAATARQVIIQKLREAEKEVVFSDFQSRVGEIVSGVVYRFERGNIIVDLLGKAEGMLFKREQSPHEEYKQGQRIRAYVVEVRKEPKGPQIILSRTHPNLVKKLFELEVPEIYDGIVEIKSIARQPGERTKIAVWSKNEKVDSLGACVGMRGNRVRNIVNELQGERIDIVRYSDDIREYITNALSPAKISEIRLDKENKKAEVIVDDDQLSLAIGKHGQNVRLASKLIGWELDIRTKAMLAEAKSGEVAEKGQQPVGEKEQQPKEQKKTKPKAGIKKKGVPLVELSGIGEKMQAALKEAGVETVEELLQASIETLTKIKGIGEKRAKKLLAQAQEIVKSQG